MELHIVVPLFLVMAAVFLVVVYGVMKSPEQEEKERQQEELDREMREFFKRQNDQNRDTPSYDGENIMSKELAFDFLDGGPGWETVALRRFGGRLGDREAAWILVSGYPVIRVVAPAIRSEWNQGAEDRFRETVRALAATHRFERSGPVSVLFDPPDTNREVVTEIPEGEPVDRLRT